MSCRIDVLQIYYGAVAQLVSIVCVHNMYLLQRDGSILAWCKGAVKEVMCFSTRSPSTILNLKLLHDPVAHQFRKGLSNNLKVDLTWWWWQYFPGVMVTPDLRAAQWSSTQWKWYRARNKTEKRVSNLVTVTVVDNRLGLPIELWFNLSRKGGIVNHLIVH